MEDGSGDATRLLGLAGLGVERVALTSLGIRVVQLVTADPDAARCPDCRQRSTSGKEWTLTRPRDLPVGGTGVRLQWRKRRWRKRRWRCRTATCTRQTFTEQVPELPARARTTRRLRVRLATAVEDGRSQTEVAATFGVSWPTVQRAVVAHAQAELGEPTPTPVLGIDETRFGRPRWTRGAGGWVRSEPWETGFVDLAGGQGLLGQVDGRATAAVRSWLEQRTPEFRAAVEVVAIDPHAGYARAVRELLPHAALAVDHFHLILLANRAVTAVRQRVTRELLHRRGRATDPAWANRRAAAARPRAPVGAGAGADVERVCRPRPHRADPHRLDRQGGTPRPMRARRPRQ